MSFPSTIAILIGLTAAAPQDTPRDLADMVGARAGQAEGELQRRGYRNVRGEKGDDRSYTYWWNADRRQCATIATMNGRYDSITATPAPDCGKTAGGGDRRGGRDDRDGREHRRYPAAVGATGDLPRFCRGEASAAFDRRPSEITVNAAIRQPRGFIVQGWFDENKRSHFFNCYFDEDGGFLRVN